MLLELPTNALEALGTSTEGIGNEVAGALASNPSVLIIGVLLIAAAIVIFYFIKKIIVNSVLGFVGWLLLMIFIGIETPLIIPTLAVSVIFGLGGVGALLVLMFFGII